MKSVVISFSLTTIKGKTMSKSETCSNQNSPFFEVVVTKDGVTRTFDSFDCAIEAMAPPCENCGCLITGSNSVEVDTEFCCSACQRQAAESSNRLMEAV